MSAHVITVEGPLAFPGGKNGWYQARCSCERYVSPASPYPGRAEAMGMDHANAKTTRPADRQDVNHV